MERTLEPNPPVEAPPLRQRLFFVDNLRWTVILLVISMHAADTYSPLGSWYFTDRAPLSTAELLTFALWQTYLQSFFMGLLFFLSGFFVPASFDRKGPAKFLRERAFRLGLPVLFYMFVLGPITEYFCAHSWNSTEPTSFANEWIKHIRNGEFLQENGPLWFCLALLIFCLIYVAFRSARPPSHNTDDSGQPPRTSQLIVFALTLTAFSSLVRLPFPSGLSFLNMHLSDFPQYILLFAVGIVAARRDWLPKLSYSLGIRWLAIVLPAGFLLWLALAYIKVSAPFGNIPLHSFRGSLLSVGFNLWESFTCVAICYGLLVLFRKTYNHQGRLEKFFSDNAFSVYVFHPPIVILAARLLHPLTAPPLAKFVLLTTIATVVTYALSAAVFRRIPWLRNIL